jgi:D-sedoheptulose 7-phosphate isomerase
MKKTSTPLEDLYPFLHGKQKSSQSDLDSLLISIQQKAAESVRVSQQFFKDNAQAVIDASKAIANVYIQGGRMLTMGNGGSSCDASQ